MARKTQNRKDLRAANDAAEALVKAVDAVAPKKAKKAAAPRKSKAKTPKEVRLKALWGVFNQSMKRIAVFEYAEKKKAEKKAEELSGSQKSPHFVQIVKEEIKE